MRPLKLAMTAFGPYKQREVIDFSLLQERRLFVISGNTGAGKTTIFDAICYALYGTASGEDRDDARMLRSHFADEQTHTSVELEFAVQNRTFRVFRQMGHRKDGNKTETGGKAELYETTGGREIPCVDRFSVSDVNRKILEIIGLTREQFIQIVMLPQGEFRRLLTSETENKEEILRKLFRTGLYQKLQEKFQQKRKAVYDALQQSRLELDVYIRQIAAVLPSREDSPLFQTLSAEYINLSQVVAGLLAESEFYGRQAEEFTAQKVAAEQALKQLEREYYAAQKTHEQFAEYERKQALFAELNEQLPQIREKEQAVKMAEKAVALVPYEEHLRISAAAEARKQAEAHEQRQALAAAEKQLKLAEQAYQQEAAREDERKRSERERDRLAEWKPAVEHLQKERLFLEKLASEVKESAARLENAEREMQQGKAQKQALQEQIKKLETAVSTLPDKKEQLNQLRFQAKLLQDLLELEKRMDGMAQKEEEQERAFLAVKEEHDRLESAWLEGQAALLAAHLHEGEPCPVCGSTVHPQKAAAAGSLPDKERLERLKERMKQLEQAYHAAKIEAAAAQSQRGSLEHQLQESKIDFRNARGTYDTIVREGKRLKEEVARLESEKTQLETVKRQAEKTEQLLEQLAARKEQWMKAYSDLLVQFNARQSAYEKELGGIPPELRDAAVLDKRLQEAEERCAQMQRAWREAEAALTQAKARFIEANTNHAQAAKQWAEAQTALREAEQRFLAELAKSGFSTRQEYETAKLRADEREARKAEVESFHAHLAALSRQLAELKAALDQRERPDLAAIEENIARQKQELEAVQQTLQHVRRCRQDADALRAKIGEISADVRRRENELGQIQDLYDALKGDNPLKISFERYVLIEYLEQILQAANERLRRLSGGQFILERSTRLEKHNRQSGLGLDVYDAYTGQKRDVKTLSGGEKFHASLALALGMTDVIQAYQGGVSIEMMFIDEGFGSLDEDALHKAIEALVELQKSGRMIGVISHVQELKNTFPAVLEVKKTRDGSSRTAMILK